MEQANQTTTKQKKIKLDFKDSKYATGRRKRSIAKVWLKKGTGKINVNGKNYDTYFKRETHKMQLLKPLPLFLILPISCITFLERKVCKCKN